jgi:hypothetical protein
MFEITSDDIALLNDEDLRSLVGLLSEAEMRNLGYSPACVTWGGHQDAKDGGVDVRVSLPIGSVISGFVPSTSTGFQVKAEDMPPAKILAEMRPSDAIRPAIQELANQSGAYIIVSSKGSTSDSALQSRRDAMATAVGVSNARSLILDFYDRTRLATWVRDHAGLIAWVKGKVGKAIPGWSSYGNWANKSEGNSGQYLLDDTVRINTGKEQSENGLSALAGIKCIRNMLRNSRCVVRLVGLSGVGKTRFVQALFDDRIGEHHLDPSLAVYTNMADAPEPQPLSLASDLIASRSRAILVIDNCAPDLHRRLSDVCREPASTLSIITVEYDIREDEPEGTEVFKLTPSSIELIEKLVRNRFPNVSEIDARTISNFSDGNARIAIALAETIGKKETIAGLSDEDLFRRLFEQRHGHDESLLRAAQACSLVYSFQGEDISDGDQAELARIGTLVGKSAQDMYSSVAELTRRDLVQRRSVWRAILPHAIANRLAATALQNIPFESIEAQIVNGGSERLAKSFSRRLSYLHQSQEARTIARRWLALGGLLENLRNLNSLGQTMFNNIAPIDPEATLSSLERACLDSEGISALQESQGYVHILRSLAYDAELFDRCVALILKIAEPQNVNGTRNVALDDTRNEAMKVFKPLFYIHLSGTHATIKQRLRVIEQLLLSDDAKRRSLGLMALKSVLKTSHFDASHNFEFGARPRDYGYWPRNRSEIEDWFGSTLRFVEAWACSNRPDAPQVRSALALELGDLWNRTAMYDALENLCHSIATTYFWPEGWIAVRRTLQSGHEPANASARLSSLEMLLRPTDLVHKVRSIVCSTGMRDLDLDYLEGGHTEDLATRMARTETLVRDLGRAVAGDKAALAELLPELVSNDGRLWSFGCGLAEGSDEPNEVWNRLAIQLVATENGKRRVEIFCGIINELHQKNPSLANTLLEDTLQSDALVEWYPRLQASAPIDKEGVARLFRSLELGKTPITSYRHLAWGAASASISGEDMKKLVLEIAAQPNGFDAALEIISMRIYPDKTRDCEPDIVEAGCSLLRQLKFSKNRNSEDYNIGRVVQACLVGERGVEVVKEICRKLKYSTSKHETHAFHNCHLLESLFIVQPAAALDELLGTKTFPQESSGRLLEYACDSRNNPLDVVLPEDLLRWCNQDPEIRYPRIAAFMTVSRVVEKPSSLAWADTALRVLENAPDRIAVLKEFVNQLVDITSWSGSRAAAMETNARLLDGLMGYPDTAVVDFVVHEKVRIRQMIESERHRERFFDRQRDERFE